jgi:pre-rRNA-processing protein TSR1
VAGAGDFQLSKIDILKDPFPLNERRGHNLMESEDNMSQVFVHTLFLLVTRFHIHQGFCISF